MFVKFREYVKFPENEIIKQILEENEISVMMKSSKEILGDEIMGEGTIFDIYVEEEDLKDAEEIIEAQRKGGSIEDGNESQEDTTV